MRIFCIGRNYADHVAELGNEPTTEMVVFMKPSSCLLTEGKSISFPSHGKKLHHEAEIVVQIGQSVSKDSGADLSHAIFQIGIGLDLTLRDVQTKLKSMRLPWEKAKAFNGSSPLGKMIKYTGQDLSSLQIGCRVNGQERQNGNTNCMLFPIRTILTELSQIWQLDKGDLIYTGTPSGVGVLKKGDDIEIFSKQIGSSRWKVV